MHRLPIAVALVAVMLPVVPSSAASKRTCGPKKAQTEVTSRYGRVYGYDDPGDPDTSYVAACLFRGGKPVVLTEFTFGAGGVGSIGGPYVLAGRFVAYADGICQADCRYSLNVIDLKRRRVTRSTAPRSGEPVKIVATFSGLAAVLGKSDNSQYYVEVLDKAGAVELDRGYDLRSLSLARHTLRWLHDGAERTYELR
jgi:hypothetical protein